MTCTWWQRIGWRVPVAKANGELPALFAREFGLPAGSIQGWRIIKQSVDARHEPVFVYTVQFALSGGAPGVPGAAPVEETPAPPPVYGNNPLSGRPLVVGFGPAGIFAALLLARRGYRPLVLERGRPLAQRVLDVDAFWRTGVLETESNVQFGAGGAGTFSDGKLQSRSKDPRQAEVFACLIEAGAPAEIAYRQGAHLGTDRLRAIVARLQEMAEEAGAEVRYEARVMGFRAEAGHFSGVLLGDGAELSAGGCVLCPGHSARDTFAALRRDGVPLAAKPFAIGVRLEHWQRPIDERQYRRFAGHPALGAADYRLAWQDPESGRGVYTFCMCPGGQVIAAASEPGGVVTNGMSYADRGGPVANSALVVTVQPADFGGDGDPLAGVAWQRHWEQAAYVAGGGGFFAPYQTVGDFLAGRTHNEREPDPPPTYRPGVKAADLRACLPDFVAGALARALPALDRLLPGFAAPHSPLTGVETRTSSPVRILRGPELTIPGWEGLYPAGEGAGYAGGIISAAVDGLRAAEALTAHFARPS